MYEREACGKLLARLKESRRFIQVLVGPRQVGKTTIVKQVLSKLEVPYLYVSADAVPSENLGWIGDTWELARTRMRVGGDREFVLAIDEIQKIRNWSEAVKKEWDADTFADVNIKVVLLGSSRVMLERGLSESMQGRFEELRVAHWSFPEMQAAFGFDEVEYMYFGGYPGAATLAKDYERWSEYIGTSIIEATIQKDVLMGSNVAKPALLRQAFELGAQYSGKELSYTKMMGSLVDAGNTTTLAGYLALLSAAGMLSALPKCTVDQARQRASSPKFQVHDNSLRSHYLGVPPKDIMSNPVEWGRCVESAVGAHLMSRAFVDNYEAMYWRDGELEVDFVLKKQGKLVAIEVKTNRETFTSGMAEFRKRFKPHGVLLVGPEGMPVGDFLALNPLDLFR
ncbi:MAG: ATP-binding protein [Kiritimatiellae bacterium]|nr:ATP-binding protein [Kiritimatiellia bacterium]